MTRPPTGPTLFPYTTLFRSKAEHGAEPPKAGLGFVENQEHPALLAKLAQALEILRWGDNKDRKSTRLNSSHVSISYAVFCLKKKKDPSEDGRRSARQPSPTL